MRVNDEFACAGSSKRYSEEERFIEQERRIISGVLFF
jgi:hypothetical protein